MSSPTVLSNGAIIARGLGRFPTTLYYSQWERIFAPQTAQQFHRFAQSLPSRFAAGLPTVDPEVLDRMVSDRNAECPYRGFPAGLKSVVCDRCRAGIPASVSRIGGLKRS